MFSNERIQADSRQLPTTSRCLNHNKIFLFQTTTKGFTGNIQFNEFGQRINFRLHYSKLNNVSEFIHVGYWDSKTDMITDEREVKERSSTSKSVIRVCVYCNI